jgi:hypothetical protein
VYFFAIVLLGAFFLINLTLAVINASFTKSQHEMDGDNIKKEEDTPTVIGEIEIGDNNDELGIS